MQRSSAFALQDLSERVNPHPDGMIIDHHDVPSLRQMAEAHGGTFARATAPSGTQLAREGDLRREVLILLDGFAVAAKRTRDGMQQNVAIHIDGDVISRDSYALGTCSADVTAMTAVGFIKLAHEQLAKLLDTDPRFARAFWRQVAFQGAIEREGLLHLGCRPALARMAHLFCEIAFRLHRAGRGDLRGCMMPLNQMELAETLGLSTVHVNRTLQVLRQQGLIALRSARLVIPDWQRLVEVAQFESAYLTHAA